MQFHLIYVHWNSLYKNWWRRWAVATLIYNKMRHEWDDIYLNSFNVSVSTRLKVYCLIFSYFFKKGEILHFLNIAKNKEDGKQVLLFFNLWYESRKKIIHSDEKEKKGDSSIKKISSSTWSNSIRIIILNMNGKSCSRTAPGIFLIIKWNRRHSFDLYNYHRFCHHLLPFITCVQFPF